MYAYVIREDPITLIDAGLKSEESKAALEFSFDRLGLSFEDIERVVVTHYHRDHLGLAQTLREASPDLEVWAHVDEVANIESYRLEIEENIEGTDQLFQDYGVPVEALDRHNRGRRELMRRDGVLCEPTRVDRALRHGDCVAFKDLEFDVIHAPGHTAGHLLLHEKDSGTLLCGDHIVGDSVPFVETYYLDDTPAAGEPMAMRRRFRGLPEYMRSVRSLRGLSLQAILSGHGPLLGRPDRILEAALLFYDVRIQRIERGLRKLAAMGQDVTAWDMWSALFPKADPETDLHVSMLAVIGVLDVLEESGACASSRRDDGIIVHRHV